jgi:hypothetical protein
MLPMKRSLPTAAALFALVVSAYAGNGVVISMKTTSGASSTTSQIQLDANHMRAQMAGRGGDQNGVIFDGVKQSMLIVDDTKKTYSEITKDDVDRLAAQMQQMQSQMQGAMGSLSPEQRAQVEAMMRGRGGRGMPGMAGAPAAKPTFKKTGTDKVGKWTCDKYEGYEGERKTSEVCTVASTALGLSDSDFAVTKDFAKFFSAIVPQGSMQVFSLGTLEDRGFVGVPVRTITYAADGSVSGTTELSDISHQNIPDSTFAPPTGYAKQDMSFGGRGRRGGD